MKKILYYIVFMFFIAFIFKSALDTVYNDDSEPLFGRENPIQHMLDGKLKKEE